MPNTHVPGRSLSAAELRQRREAGRRSHAGHVAGLIGGGGAIGGLIGGGVGMLRHGPLTANQTSALARGEAVNIAARLRQSDDIVAVESTQRRRMYEALINRRLRSTRESVDEARQRVAETAAARRLNIRPPPEPPPVVGTTRNLEIYNFQLDRLRRRHRVENRHLQRIMGAPEVDESAFLAQHARTQAAREAVTNLEELQRLGPRLIARRGARRATGTTKATNEKKFRQGETQAQLQARIDQSRQELRDRLIRFNRQADRHAGVIRDIRREQILREATETVEQAFHEHAYGAGLRRAGARGALLGAGLGLGATGLAVLVRHLAAAHHKVEDGVDPSGLKKAEPAEPDAPPEKSKSVQSDEEGIARRLAAMYRGWIDRLLGRDPTPIAMGDDVAGAIGPGIVSAYAEGLESPPITIPDPLRRTVEVNFDVLNPATRRHMVDYALDRIVEISEGQREAIRDAIMEGPVLQGRHPYTAARRIKESIGLTTYQRGVVESFRQMLRALDPRIFERALRDRRYDATIKKAIETNTPLTDAQVEEMVDAYHRRFIALRARTIARTESLRATSFGGLARVQETLDDHPDLDVTKHWLSTSDGRTRETHVDLDGKSVTGIGTPFITSHQNAIRWPLDADAVAAEVINCRCTLRYHLHPRRVGSITT